MTTSLDAENRRSYRKLVLSIAASENTLNLLMAICDDRNLRQQIIQDYEAELRERSVVTVLGADELIGVRLREARSGADELIGVRLREARSEVVEFLSQ
ncbi:MAG: hypothetical protein KME15_10800 [Drouetiella hepatica Uher 2000/2452]|uniref:Uncharacterized protein n=1 Tax=Drouetiella hepatica Uher 2000/2452 TaxID=904376 RepID=A0A951QC39_9CYAN|nr:hypothetical protein [Drouetiella hepatica Uher 2000/2452]